MLPPQPPVASKPVLAKATTVAASNSSFFDSKKSASDFLSSSKKIDDTSGSNKDEADCGFRDVGSDVSRGAPSSTEHPVLKRRPSTARDKKGFKFLYWFLQQDDKDPDSDDDAPPTWSVSEGGDLYRPAGCEVLSERICGHMGYWFVHTFFILMEPVICSSRPQKSEDGEAVSYFKSWTWKLQVAVLVISSVMLWAQIDLVARKAVRDSCWDGNFGSRFAEGFRRVFLYSGDPTQYRYSEVKGVMIEVLCLLCGWVFIWWRPGVAVLRCFRTLRILFYNDLPNDKPVFDNESKQHQAGPRRLVRRGLAMIFGCLFLEIFFDKDLPFSVKLARLIFKVMKFTSYTLEHLAEEMFYLTSSTKGGFVLMVMLFYSMFVLGLVSWIDTTGDLQAALSNPAALYTLLSGKITARSSDLALLASVDGSGDALCVSADTCVQSIMRLTVWDGSGFDFLWVLHKKKTFLFAIIIVYFCATAFGILNGLTGIFRKIVTRTSNRAFASKSKLQENEDKEILKKKILERRHVVATIAKALPEIKKKLLGLELAVTALEERRAAAKQGDVAKN